MMDDDQRRHIADFANTVTWKQPELRLLEAGREYPFLAERIQHQIIACDARKQLLLPDLSAFDNGAVAIFSDYGGEDKASKFATYSSLICGWELVAPFEHMMRRTRARHDLGDKEIAYKDFGMGQVRRALPDYLRALDTVPGFLLTIAIDKRLTSVFGSDVVSVRQFLEQSMHDAGFSPRKPFVLEKLLRIVHMNAFLTALLARSGQKIFWMSDHDAIAPNEALHRETLDLFQRALGIYVRPHTEYAMIGGGAPFKERYLTTLDLLSAADVAAGAFAQRLTTLEESQGVPLKDGCNDVLAWMGRDGLGLKKLCLRMQINSQGTIETSQVQFQSPLQPGTTIVPIAV